MECPICNTRKGIEIDIHSDGYADNLFECSFCGAVWISEFDEITMITQKVA